jgi:catechol 2,3-dioxygenase-like lactoylglutathione lyase family enzyme
MAPTLEGFDHIHVFVADRAASEEWYARVMGLRRVTELEAWSSGGGPLTIGNASGTVHLALFERPVEKCRSTVALSTTASAFLAWRAHLSGVFARSIEVVDHELSWSLYFTDPDGNPFEITSYEYKSLAAVLGKSGG